MTKSCSKKSLILLEVIVASCLIAVFIGFLFKTYFQFQTTQLRTERLRKIVFARQKTQLKLQQIFLHLTHYTLCSEGLLLEYLQPLDPQLEFRGECRSLLHLKDNFLILTTWGPLPTEPPRHEVLLEVSSKSPLEFQIFDKDKKAFRPLSLEEKVFDSPMLKICVGGTYFPFNLRQVEQLSSVIEEENNE